MAEILDEGCKAYGVFCADKSRIESDDVFRSMAAGCKTFPGGVHNLHGEPPSRPLYESGSPPNILVFGQLFCSLVSRL